MNYNNSSQQNAIVHAIISGLGTSMVLTVLLAFAAAYAVSVEYLDETALGYIIMLITGTAAAVGSYVAVRKAEKKRLPSALTVGAVYYMVLLLIGISFFDGPKGGVFVTGILIIGCSGCVSLLTLKGKKRNYAAVRKYRNR